MKKKDSTWSSHEPYILILDVHDARFQYKLKHFELGLTKKFKHARPDPYGLGLNIN